MFNKPFTLSRFKDYLIDLSDLDATRNNELAAGYGLDGKILGIPMTAGYEYVYYWKVCLRKREWRFPLPGTS